MRVLQAQLLIHDWRLRTADCGHESSNIFIENPVNNLPCTAIPVWFSLPSCANLFKQNQQLRPEIPDQIMTRHLATSSRPGPYYKSSQFHNSRLHVQFAPRTR